MSRKFLPLFMFSLPRSGSTLLQRVLSSHEEISTVAEPWLLLPVYYALKDEGIEAEYSQKQAALALKGFLSHMDDGEQAYRNAVRTLAYDMYGQIMVKQPGKYFLDKTPRYYYVAREIAETFTEGKFIFLWRNPLAAAASMLDTWSGGRFRIDRHYRDLETGLNTLIDVYAACERDTLSLRYEDFVTDPKGQLDKIWSYLELERDPSVLDAFQFNELKGRMGDPKRIQRSQVSSASLGSWVNVMNSPVRRWWCRRYLDQIGVQRLRKIGYDREEILRDLYAAPPSYRKIPGDLFYLLKAYILTKIKRVYGNFR